MTGIVCNVDDFHRTTQANRQPLTVTGIEHDPVRDTFTLRSLQF